MVAARSRRVRSIVETGVAVVADDGDGGAVNRDRFQGPSIVGCRYVDAIGLGRGDLPEPRGGLMGEGGVPAGVQERGDEAARRPTSLRPTA
jgi:hypothetical protein